MSPDVIEGFRYAGVVVTALTLATLGFQMIANYRARGLDYSLRMGGLGLVFCALAYAAIQSLRRTLPPQDYHVYYTVSVTVFWVTLLAPWRWRFRRP